MDKAEISEQTWYYDFGTLVRILHGPYNCMNKCLYSHTYDRTTDSLEGIFCRFFEEDKAGGFQVIGKGVDALY